jgi:hypothetical protein
VSDKKAFTKKIGTFRDWLIGDLTKQVYGEQKTKEPEKK